MSAPTKAELLDLIESQKETIGIQARTIDHQNAEITNASQQITAICEGLAAAVEANAQTRAMVEEVEASIQRDYPIAEGFWN
jgi:methyl-accepting chemotaxis protein